MRLTLAGILQDIWHAIGRIVLHLTKRHRDCAAAKADIKEIFKRIERGQSNRFVCTPVFAFVFFISLFIGHERAFVSINDFKAALISWGRKWTTPSAAATLSERELGSAALASARAAMARQPLPDPPRAADAIEEGGDEGEENDEKDSVGDEIGSDESGFADLDEGDPVDGEHKECKNEQYVSTCFPFRLLIHVCSGLPNTEFCADQVLMLSNAWCCLSF